LMNIKFKRNSLHLKYKILKYCYYHFGSILCILSE